MPAPDPPPTDPNLWTTVDTYLADLLAPKEPILTELLQTNAKAGLPRHDVSALQGQMLALLIQIAGARCVLEIGTLGGYSTIRMARSLPPGGSIVTIEANPRHATVARRNFEQAGLAARIHLLEGQALEILPTLKGPFDLIFIDADKPNNPNYIHWALELSHPGTVIIADNVVRAGAIADPQSADPNAKGLRTFLEIVASEPRLTATAIQTVGEKGWDGFVLARVG